MAVLKLSKRLVEGLEAPQKGELWVWDTEVRGLGLKVNPTGRRLFFLKYRNPGERVTRKFTIGPFGPLTVDQARAQAQRLRGNVIGGADPGRERARGKAAPTVASALTGYLGDHEGKWKPRTMAEYRRQATQLIIPAIGTMRVQDVSRTDVAHLVRQFRERPVLGNRVLALLSAFFTWSVRSGLRPDEVNPCRLLPRHAERHRARFLTGEEITRLGAALTAAEQGHLGADVAARLSPAPWQTIAAIRLLLFTGCRKSEILDLRWSEVDFERGMLHLRDTKAGESARPLNAPARAILESLRRGRPEERVLPGTRGRRHEVKPAWTVIRRNAKLDGVRLHDLRHTLASRSQHAGHSLLVTGSLLGHRSLATTKRYAHLVDEPLQAAANHLGGDLDALLRGAETPVVPLATATKRKRMASSDNRL